MANQHPPSATTTVKAGRPRPKKTTRLARTFPISDPPLRRTAARRSARIASQTAPSSARQVYDILELRSRILQLLRSPDLAKFMRVERTGPGMSEVARVLYRSVKHRVILNLLDMSTPRQAIYCAAVREVLLDRINSFESRAPSAQSDLATPIRLLRQGLPNLLRVVVGPRYRTMSRNDDTIYHFNPIRGSGTGLEALTAPTLDYFGAAQVDIFEVRVFSLSDPPPTAAQIYPTPSQTATISYRFNLRLEPPHRSRPALINEWLSALRTDPSYGDLRDYIELFELPVTFADIRRLYDRQRESGHASLLGRIIAPRASLWGVSDLQSLAALAGASLTELHLASSSYNESSVNLSFEDLPRIVEIIQSSLSNLKHLHIALKGIDHAESICKPHLLPDCLSVTGSLRIIIVTTAPHTVFQFNALRVLAPLLALRRCLEFEPSTAKWSLGAHEECLTYLRNQIPSRQAYLATCDLPSLHVFTPVQLRDLTYDDDGQPRRRGSDSIDEWAETAKTLATGFDTLLDRVQKAVSALNQATAQLASLPAGAPRADVMIASGKVRAAYEEYGLAAAAIGRTGATALAKEAEVKKYIHAEAAQY